MPYIIDLQLNGAQQVLAQVKQLSSGFAALNQAMNGGGSGGGSRNSHSGFAGGPFQRFQASQAKLAFAMQYGNWSQQMDAILRYQASLKAVNRAYQQLTGQGNGFAASLAKLMHSTRIGLTPSGAPSVMPLIGDLMSVTSALPAELKIVVMLLLAFGIALKKAIQAAMKFGTEMATAYYMGGGSLKDTVNLARIGAGAGLSATQMAELANGINQSLINNPYARAIGSRAGISPNYIGSYGNINDAARAAKLINYFLNASDDVAQRMLRAIPELKAFAYERFVDPAIRNKYNPIMDRAATPESMGKAANAQFLWNTAMSQVSMLLVQMGNTYLPTVIQALDRLGKILDWLNHQVFIGPIWNLFTHHDHVKKANQAMDSAADSANNFARALDDARQSFGGGDYSRRALPDKYFNDVQAGASWNQSRQRRSIHLGEIPIG